MEETREPRVLKSFTSFNFDSILGDDGYHTIVASCTQSRHLEGEEPVERTKSVRILDRNISRGMGSAYIALLQVMDSEGYDLLGNESSNEQSGEHHLN